MKKLISISLILSLVLLCFTACSPEIRITGERYTDYEGVYITVESTAVAENNSRLLNVTWHNETEDYVTFGLWYTVEYLEGDEWRNIQIVDYAIPEIACHLEANSTGEQKYTTKYFNMLREGTYRIRTEFYVPEKDVGTRSTYATFEVRYL